MSSPHVHIPFNKLLDHLDFIREKDLNLEIYFAGDVLDCITLEDVRQAGSLLDHSPSLSFHAPFMDLSPGAVDSLVRESTMKRLGQILDIAEVLNPKTIVCHSGYEKWPSHFRSGATLHWAALSRESAADVRRIGLCDRARA